MIIVDDLVPMDENASNDVRYDNLVDNFYNQGFKGDNPLDNWQHEASANIDDLSLEHEFFCQASSNDKTRQED